MPVQSAFIKRLPAARWNGSVPTQQSLRCRVCRLIQWDVDFLVRESARKGSCDEERRNESDQSIDFHEKSPQPSVPVSSAPSILGAGCKECITAPVISISNATGRLNCTNCCGYDLAGIIHETPHISRGDWIERVFSGA
jgi:hypothetical protein